MSVERLRPVPLALLPASLRGALEPTQLRVRGARVAAAKALTIAQVEEAVALADEQAVEAWMAEVGRGQVGFRATRSDLERLVAAKAPDRVIDMAVVVANPQHFEPRVERVAGPSVGSAHPRDLAPWCMDGLSALPWVGYGMWNPWMMPMAGSSAFGRWSECSIYSYYSRSSLSPFGLGYFGPGMFPGYGYYPRRIVVTPVGGGSTAQPLGRVEKGAGRRAPASGETRAAQPRTPPATVRQPAAGAASSGESSGRTRTGSGSGTGRTAQPRNPDKKP
jgi:hypothetical protein